MPSNHPTRPTRHASSLPWLSTAGLSVGALFLACSAAGGSDGAASSGGADDGGPSAQDSAASSSGGSGSGSAIDAADSSTPPSANCGTASFEATVEYAPTDVIFVIDNSGSMDKEIAAIEQNINVNFANIIQGAQLDFRLIVLSQIGPSNVLDGAFHYGICIGPPLGGNNCPVPHGSMPNNTANYFHYVKSGIESHDALCKLIEDYDQPDQHGLAPKGWGQWLRKESIKHFVVFTDDGVTCAGSAWFYSDSNTLSGGQQVAQKFDADLLVRAPEQFGTSAARRYYWHSVVGIAPNPANPTKAYGPQDPPTLAECASAVDPGTGYQALSNLTGGIKFPVCEGQGFDVVFQEIAKKVISGATITCEFELPEPPKGKEIDPTSLSIEYLPAGDATKKQVFDQVSGPTQCQSGKFYIDNDKLKLCPEVCDAVQNDQQAVLKVLVGCLKDAPT